MEKIPLHTCISATKTFLIFVFLIQFRPHSLKKNPLIPKNYDSFFHASISNETLENDLYFAYASVIPYGLKVIILLGILPE
jgi:hypothetical protein